MTTKPIVTTITQPGLRYRVQQNITASGSAQAYNFHQLGEIRTRVSNATMVFLLFGLLCLLLAVSVVLATVSVAAFGTGRDVLGVGALGPAVAAIVAVFGLEWRVLSRTMRK